MTDDEQIIFAKVDAHLDGNPKIGAAGPLAREIYAFVLRQNAIKGSLGWIKASYVGADHLADNLKLDLLLADLLIRSGVTLRDGLSLRDVTRDAANVAVTACVTHKLLAFDETNERVLIVGWSDRWGRKSKSGKERSKKWREGLVEKQSLTGQDNKRSSRVTKRDGAASRVTERDACDAVEESRVEKKQKRSRKSADADQSDLLSGLTGFREVSAAYDDLFKRANGGHSPTWGPKLGAQVKQLLKMADATEIVRRMGIMYTSPPDWMKAPRDIGTLIANFDKLVAPSEPQVSRRAVDRPGAPSEAL